MTKNNIILIGMPGAGKSTIGVLLAKAVRKPFLDTDLIIQQQENRYLQDIIDEDGLESFLAIEEKSILELKIENHIIATGGSVVYSSKAMDSLKQNGIVVYLELEYIQLEQRINNITTRGIAMKQGQKLIDVYKERIPLYSEYADIKVNCSNKHIEAVVAEIKSLYMSQK